MFFIPSSCSRISEAHAFTSFIPQHANEQTSTCRSFYHPPIRCKKLQMATPDRGSLAVCKLSTLLSKQKLIFCPQQICLFRVRRIFGLKFLIFLSIYINRDLSSNKIENLTEDSFSTLKYLEYLYVASYSQLIRYLNDLFNATSLIFLRRLKTLTSKNAREV